MQNMLVVGQRRSMSRSKELQELLEASGTTRKEYYTMYHNVWQQMRNDSDKRYSGSKYTNTPERIQAIKEKYANGVTSQHIKEMVDSL